MELSLFLTPDYMVNDTNNEVPHCGAFYTPHSNSSGPNIRLRTLFSDTLSLRSPLNESDHVPQPYIVTGNIIVNNNNNDNNNKNNNNNNNNNKLEVKNVDKVNHLSRGLLLFLEEKFKIKGKTKLHEPRLDLHLHLF